MNRAVYNPFLAKQGIYADENGQELFDDDYIALLALISVALQVYGLNMNEKDEKRDNAMYAMMDELCEEVGKLSRKIDRIERLLERNM